MRLTRLSLLVLLACAAGAHAQVYKWVDKDGKVRYTDQPPPEARDVKPAELKPLTRLESAPIESPTAEPEDPEPQDEVERPAFAGYRSVSILRPTADQTLNNIGGELSVQVGSEPGLQPGHRVIVSFDGKDQPAGGRSVTLREVYRGSHTLVARIEDESGVVLARSPAVTFHVQQAQAPRAAPPPKK